MGHGDDAFGDGVGEGRDAVDDDEGVADEGGFDGGGAAGDDGGAGVEEGRPRGTCGAANCAEGIDCVSGAAVADDPNVELRAVLLRRCEILSGGRRAVSVEARGSGKSDCLVPGGCWTRRRAAVSISGRLSRDLLGAAAGKQGDPGVVAASRSLFMANYSRLTVGRGRSASGWPTNSAWTPRSR